MRKGRQFTDYKTPLGIHKVDAIHIMDRLTPKEHEVADLIADDLSTDEIIEKLKISVKTFNIHKGRIKNKLGVQGSAGIARIVLASCMREEAFDDPLDTSREALARRAAAAARTGAAP